MVSVIIPLYNHEKYIIEAIDSVLAQSYSDIELIIVDDGSVDKSYEVAASVRDKRIRLFKQQNLGAHAAINFGVSEAKGEYVSILNSDDFYDKNRLQVIVEEIKVKGVDAVFTDLFLINSKGKTLRKKGGAADNWNYCQTRQPNFRERNFFLTDLLAGNFLVTTSNLFCRRSVFEKLGGFRPFRYVHDYDFFLRLATSDDLKVSFVDKPLCFYRLHSNNTISESQVKVSYEVGLMFSSLYLNNRLKLKTIRGAGSLVEYLACVFNSLNFVESEKLILSVILSGCTAEELDDAIDKIGNGRFDSLLNSFTEAR